MRIDGDLSRYGELTATLMTLAKRETMDFSSDGPYATFHTDWYWDYDYQSWLGYSEVDTQVYITEDGYTYYTEHEYASCHLGDEYDSTTPHASQP